MADVPRNRVDPPLTVVGISEAQHQALMRHGTSIDGYWSLKEKSDLESFDAFKQELKDHYYWGQGGRCCYCSSPLKESKRTWDLEHVLDKSSQKALMFCVRNLAVACAACNGSKSTRCPLLEPVNHSFIGDPPASSADYRIVHPHLDDWEQHLQFDELGRVEARGASQKGIATIKLCGIDKQNVTALAVVFTVDGREARDLLNAIFSAPDDAEKEFLLGFLQELASSRGNAKAAAVVAALGEEINVL